MKARYIFVLKYFEPPIHASIDTKVCWIVIFLQFKKDHYHIEVLIDFLMKIQNDEYNLNFKSFWKFNYSILIFRTLLISYVVSYFNASNFLLNNEM